MRHLMMGKSFVPSYDAIWMILQDDSDDARSCATSSDLASLSLKFASWCKSDDNRSLICSEFDNDEDDESDENEKLIMQIGWWWKTLDFVFFKKSLTFSLFVSAECSWSQKLSFSFSRQKKRKILSSHKLCVYCVCWLDKR